jgi:hypothetical protein
LGLFKFKFSWHLALTTNLSLLVSWLERRQPVRGGEHG